MNFGFERQGLGLSLGFERQGGSVASEGGGIRLGQQRLQRREVRVRARVRAKGRGSGRVRGRVQVRVSGTCSAARLTESESP